MAGFDWSRIDFTEYMTEAARVVVECHVVLTFGPDEQVTYEFKVCESLEGSNDERYFAVGVNRDDPEAFRPVASATTAEQALQECLVDAGIHHRRQMKQAGDPHET
jgi:hypothetical protein